MRLIKNVEIGYFRSIYKESIDCDSDLNIVFGRNDSGKSNVLRALNLFFNAQTNPGKVFDFAMDLCQARRVEAGSKKDARKFVYIKLTFKEGANKRGNSSRLTQSFHFFMFEPI
ncbi:AAA family ATPase, partial [Aeromonas veronii]